MRAVRMWIGGATLLLAACEHGAVEAPATTDAVRRLSEAQQVQVSSNPPCTHHWASGVAGSWFDASKWSPTAIPGTGDVACIDAPGTYTVTLDPVVDATPVDVTGLEVGASTGAQTLRLTGVSLTLNVAQELHVAAAGILLFNNASGATVSAATVGIDGVLRKTAQCGGCGTADALDADVDNRGTIDVNGDLAWTRANGTYRNSGTIALSGGTGIVIPASAGAPSFTQAGGSISAPTLALLSMRAGTFTLDGGDISPSAQSNLPVVRLEGGNVILGAAAGNATLGIRGDASGAATVTGDVSATTTLWLMGSGTGASTVTLAGSPTNHGAIQVNLYNFGGGDLTIAGAGTLTNKGTIAHVIAAPLAVHYAIDVDNQGTIDAPGDMVIDKAGGLFTNSGTIVGQSAGSLSIVGATLENRSSGVISGNVVYPDAGGILRGLGSLPRVRPQNGGRVEPGLPGGAMSSTSFEPQLGSVLAIELGGTQAGIDYDQLQVSGQANFNGTLEITASNGFIAGRCGQVFDIITHGSPGGSGTFTFVNGLSPAPGQAFLLVYHTNTSPKRVSLYGYNPTTVVSVAPNPVSLAEGGPSQQYAICLDHQPTSDVTISASPNTQLTVSPSTLVFTPANYYVPQFFTVTAVDDNVVEGNHTGTVTHSASSTDGSFNNAAIAPLTATIADNDASPNLPPNAVDDAASTPEDQSVVVAVLANDSDPDGDPLAVTAVTQPLHGTATIGAGGQQVTYVPAQNYNGGDSFTYTVDDGQGHSSQATVAVSVTPVNDAPVALDDAATTTAPGAVVVSVLANDSDVDGDALTVTGVTQPSGGAGSASVTGNGTTVTYTPPASLAGTAVFTYTVGDGHGGSASATVTVTVQPAGGRTADLGIGMALGGDIVHPGYAVVVLVTEENRGPNNSPSATITIPTVPGLQFKKSTGGVCTEQANGDVVCPRSGLPNGAMRQTLVVRYKALVAGQYTVVGQISGPRPDTNAANDLATLQFVRP